MALQVGGDKEGRGRSQEADYCAASGVWGRGEGRWKKEDGLENAHVSNGQPGQHCSCQAGRHFEGERRERAKELS